MTEELMENDLRGRVVALEQGAASKEQRLIVVETWQRQADIFNARRDEQFKRIEGDLGKISGTLSRIMWLIISGIIAGVVAFLLSGGFRAIT